MSFEEHGFPSLFWTLVCLTGLRFRRSSAYDARGVLFVVIHEYSVVLRAHLAEIALRTEAPRGSPRPFRFRAEAEEAVGT